MILSLTGSLALNMRSRPTARLGGLIPAHGESKSAPRSTALRAVAGELRRLAGQGDHDFAVDDLDVTDTTFSGGLESGFERRIARPPTQCGAPSTITGFSAFRWSTVHMSRAHKPAQIANATLGRTARWCPVLISI
jgi:hypothetical protein